MGAHSRDTNPSRAHRDTHTPTRSRANEPITRPNPHKVGNAPGRWLPRIPYTPANARWGHTVPHVLLSFTRSHSNTSNLTASHSTNTRAASLSQSLGPSVIPHGARARGPQTLLSSLHSLRHSKAPGIRAPLGPQPRISGPGARPLPRSRAAPPLT